MFIQSNDIVFSDFDVDDFSLTEEWVHDCQVPLVLSGFDAVVLAQLLLELLLGGFEKLGKFLD